MLLRIIKMHFILILYSIVIETVVTEDFVSHQKATECNPQVCQLPNCRCSSTDIPGGLAPKDTPQFVLITFDDAVTISNIGTYREVLYKRYNSNGCSVGATFYINHEYTNYQAVNELYNRGLEIGLHSITHRTAQGFWANASYNDLGQEFGYQRFQMAHFANIPYEKIYGLRMPFLQMSGETNFRVMVDIGLTYDHSWPTTHFIDPAIWPYTLDYPSIQDCEISPCPTSSIPGAWVVPMISWTDVSGYHCAMVDGCFAVPDRNDEIAWFEFITKNFKTHYLGNRAPFGFYIHEAYLSANPAVKRGLIRFLDAIETINDVFVVNTIDALDWVRNPTPVSEYRQQPCRKIQQTECFANSCNPLVTKHETYWMQVCNSCPRQYPWIENPLGQ